MRPARWCRSRRSLALPPARRQGADRRLPGGAAACRSMCRRSTAISTSSPGHKIYGPTGIGVLYGRYELLSAMPPWQGGGEMILKSRFEKTEFQDPPHRFEAGTPDISGAIGLGAAIDFIEELGRDDDPRARGGADRLWRRPAVAQSPDLRLVEAGQRRLGMLSFDLEGVHPHDLATVLDQHQRGGARRPSLRPAADGEARPRRRRPAPRSASTMTRAISTGWPRRSRQLGRCSCDDGFARALSGHHPRSRPAPAEFPGDRASDAFRARL